MSTPNVAGSELELDFNPIIKEKNLSGEYVIIHWQGRPKGDREWGIYSSHNDSYRSFLGGKINWSSVELFQLNDKTTNTLPSAVLIVPESKVTCIDGKAIVGEVLLSDVG
ncbi:hypothetical protein [Waterburya agarophytonicola]|uniref:hypothetical protein n=1 Tax=Waterburya agarophytonicola TaxID=2886916 RepID=UPI001E4C08A6|nr:hypothetical protein [Waterburya agarophytonicola]